MYACVCLGGGRGEGEKKQGGAKQQTTEYFDYCVLTLAKVSVFSPKAATKKALVGRAQQP